ncbi:glutathione S-transferase family protein [Glaciecola sp. 1036]|uniref:glutathione S-transferase family protein n=1 Tax=Alteromonadaceae TaxID=72275 RepID=UPI003D0288B9
MYTIHHLNDSRSQRIIWLMELLHLDYEIKVYWRDKKTNLAPQALKDLHPLGTSPIITHEGQTIAESGAICEYVIQQCGQQDLMPAQDTPEYIQVQFWSHFAEGSFLPPLVANMVLNKAKEKSPWLIKPIANKLVDAIMDAYFNKAIKRNFTFIEQYLSDKTWFVGEKPTIADVQMSFAMEAVDKAGRFKQFPNMAAYVERLQKLPSYQQALKRMQDAEEATKLD